MNKTGQRFCLQSERVSAKAKSGKALYIHEGVEELSVTILIVAVGTLHKFATSGRSINCAP